MPFLLAQVQMNALEVAVISPVHPSMPPPTPPPTLTDPFRAPADMLRFDAPTGTPRQIAQGGQPVPLKEARGSATSSRKLDPG